MGQRERHERDEVGAELHAGRVVRNGDDECDNVECGQPRQLSRLLLHARVHDRFALLPVLAVRVRRRSHSFAPLSLCALFLRLLDPLL